MVSRPWKFATLCTNTSDFYLTLLRPQSNRAGVCNFGKLNFFLGKRAADEGRESRYPDIDFCRDPEAVCSSEEHKELKWIGEDILLLKRLNRYMLFANFLVIFIAVISQLDSFTGSVRSNVTTMRVGTISMNSINLWTVE